MHLLRNFFGIGRLNHIKQQTNIFKKLVLCHVMICNNKITCHEFPEKADLIYYFFCWFNLVFFFFTFVSLELSGK